MFGVIGDVVVWYLLAGVVVNTVLLGVILKNDPEAEIDWELFVATTLTWPGNIYHAFRG